MRATNLKVFKASNRHQSALLSIPGTQILDKYDINIPWLSKETINTYLSSFAAMFVNLILIPLFIDIMVMMEDWKTKSER